MNITDIDDKIIRGAAAEGIPSGSWPTATRARSSTTPTRCGMTRPTCCRGRPSTSPRWPTLIATLLERGHAYRTDDGSIFFRIASWPAYGGWRGSTRSQLRVGERVEADEYGKDDVRDFAVWKGPKPGEPSW